jgi:hypothetical protein
MSRIALSFVYLSTYFLNTIKLSGYRALRTKVPLQYRRRSRDRLHRVETHIHLAGPAGPLQGEDKTTLPSRNEYSEVLETVKYKLEWAVDDFTKPKPPSIHPSARLPV